jgi:hypothetical protein
MDHQDGNQPYTPYTPPTADIGFEPDGDFIRGGRSVPAGHAISWISDAWWLFKQKIGLWIGFALCYVAMLFVSSIVPLGSLILSFVQFLLLAGVIHACDLLRREGSFVFGDFFAAFQRKTGPLLIACLIGLGFLFALGIVLGIFLGGSGVMAALATGDSASILSAGKGAIIGLMVIGGGGLAIYVMLVWFVPALILLLDVAPVEAIKMSFSACSKNLLPGIVFFILLTVLLIISAIPLMLGLLITMPMAFICYYTSYRDIFLGKEN